MNHTLSGGRVQSDFRDVVFYVFGLPASFLKSNNLSPGSFRCAFQAEWNAVRVNVTFGNENLMFSNVDFMDVKVGPGTYVLRQMPSTRPTPAPLFGRLVATSGQPQEERVERIH